MMPANDTEAAALHTLAAHAELATVTDDPDLDARLITRGFDGVAAIARASRDDFTARVRDVMPPEKAAAVQSIARARLATARTALAGLLTDRANGFATAGGFARGGIHPSDILEALPSGEMPIAISPAAYLCDLLQYATDHIRRVEPGLRATYYAGTDFDGATPKLSRTDHTVSFDWGGGSPDAKIPADRFCVRWEGALLPKYSETYTLITDSDDGVRLWIDDLLVIDNWTDHAPQRDTATIDLVADRHYDLRLEYYENGGGAVIKLLWKSKSQPEEIIPSSQLSTAAPIEVEFLEDLVRQPLGGLTAGGTDADEQVKQARIGIEVLRSYLARYDLPAAGSSKRTVLDAAERAYRLLAYTTLLSKLGTSYAELRLARTADAASRAALADKLGIEVSHVDSLVLDPRAPATAANALTEKHVEELFGYGATDASKRRRDVPLLERWRKEHLRALWKAQDAADDDYRAGRLAIVDPDLIGPEDFREPVPTDPAFALWLQRRQWVDGRLALARKEREQQGMDAVLARVFGRPVAELEALRAALTRSEDADAQARASSTLATELALSPEAFTRLMAIRDADIAERAGGDTVPSDDWDEAYSIMVESEKAEQVATWVAQEKPAVAFGTERFWITERAPDEGPWPPRFVLDRASSLANVDPELSDPDALQAPLAGAAAVALWDVRHAWLQQRKAQLEALRVNPPAGKSPLAALVDAVLGAHAAEVDALAAALTPASGAAAADAARRIRADLHLDIQGFRRLAAARALEKSGAAPTDDEIEACVALLLTAEKRSHFDTWSKEEATLPLVDPDVIALESLPGGEVGRPARDLWCGRRVQLDELTATIASELAAGRFQEVVSNRLRVSPDELRRLAGDAAHGDPAAVETVTHRLHLTVAQAMRLMTLGERVEKRAEAEILTDAAGILASAEKIATLHPAWLAEERKPDSGVGYWNLFPSALPRGRASADARAVWLGALTVRSGRPIVDPDVLDAAYFADATPADAAFRLWTDRQQWLDDRLHDLRTAGGSGARIEDLDSTLAIALFGEDTLNRRRGAISACRKAYGLAATMYAVIGRPVRELQALVDAARGSEATTAADAHRVITEELCIGVDALEQLLSLQEQESVGKTSLSPQALEAAERSLARTSCAAEVLGLATVRKRGKSIAPQLRRLGLDTAAFDLLLRTRGLLLAGSTLLAAERDAMLDVLVQAEKVRRFSAWREEERTAGIVVGPDHFIIPEVDDVLGLAQRTEDAQEWRTSTEAARAFLDTLQARLDEDGTVAPALRAVVSAAEEMALPTLRDALVMASDAAGVDLAAKAKWMAGRVLVDMSSAGIVETTRIAQAIESLQSLLWNARTGQLLPQLTVFRLDAPDFEEDWKWIGSYATWRAAMLVFMYPETLLLPSLRKWRTGKFTEVVAALRSCANLGPRDALDIAGEYAAYLRDVCNLQLVSRVPVTTQVKVKRPRQRSLTFWAMSPGFLSYEPATGEAELYSTADVAAPRLVASATDIGSGWDQIVADGSFGKTSADYDTFFCYNSTTGVGEFFRASRGEDGKLGTISRVNRYTGLMTGARVFSSPLLWSYVNIVFYDPAQGVLNVYSVSDCALPGFGGEIPCSIVSGLPRNAVPAPGQYGGAGKGDLLFYYPDTGVVDLFRWWTEDRLDLDHGAYPNQWHYEGFPKNAVMFTDGMSRLYLYEPSTGKMHHYVYVITGSDGSLVTTFFYSGQLTYMAEAGAQPIFAWNDASYQRSLAFYVDATGVLTFRSTGQNGAAVATTRHWNVSWMASRRSELFVARSAGAFGKAYWLRRDEIQGDAPTRTLWEPIPGFDRVGHLLGAVPFTTAAGEQRVYALAEIVAPDSTRKLEYNWYDLAADGWQPDAADTSISMYDAGVASLNPTTGTEAPTVIVPHGSWTSAHALRDGKWESCTATASQLPDPGALGDLAPAFGGPYEITDHLSDDERLARRRMVTHAFDRSTATLDTNGTYFEEAWFFVPLQIAIELQKKGQYLAALDWLRTVYDYGAKATGRKVFPGLAMEEELGDILHRDDDWMRDPLDPHLIARTRANSYTRYTLLAIARTLLAWADSEFSADTMEALARARALYQTALDLLLRSPELAPRDDATVNLLDDVDNRVQSALMEGAPRLQSLWTGMRPAVAEIFASPQRDVVRGEITDALGGDAPWATRLARVGEILKRRSVDAAAPPTMRELLATRARTEDALYARLSAVPAIGGAFQRRVQQTPQPLRGKGGIGGQNGGHSNGNGGRPRLTPADSAAGAIDIGGIEVVGADAGEHVHEPYVPRLLGEFRIPENPLWASLRLRAEVNLFKLHSGRNFAGMIREVEPYAAPTGLDGALPGVTDSGQLYLPSSPVLHPTPYRFKTLIERAKQLVQLASQTEGQMLAALQQEDSAAYTLLRARQELAVAGASITLQDTRMVEAESGVELGRLQQQRATLQQRHFQSLLAADLLDEERQALFDLKTALDFKIAATVVGSLGAIASAIGGAAVGSYFGGPAGGTAGAVVGAIGGILTAGGGMLEGISGAYSLDSSINAMQAGYLRRAQDWRFQSDLAGQDVAIGAQQVTIARDHVNVVRQERRIAQLQATHAQQVVDYLGSKFLNEEMYHWMADVLEDVYRTFLQQATAVAKLAENQLAFERHEPIPPFTQADYWNVPLENGATPPTTDATAADRRGLTGSARLLRDIYQLDEFAFETDKRKLQISRTISFASLAPVEFQRFRETGVLTLRTPMELFDHDFPGHYLRLMRRVRTSVIALVPPQEGIKAMLSTNGVSRVVVSGDTFQTVVVRRDPETVALSAPIAASGVFELEPQPEMLLPFEATGVDTTWEFRMPRAANPFDYRAIADVLLTIDYTALNSFDYYQQVVRRLDRSVTGDRAYSFRHDVADAWYDLHNPAQSATPLAVRFSTSRADFPANVADIAIEKLTLYFARAEGMTMEIPVAQLRFTARGATAGVGGSATSVDGVIGTRRGNASAWTTILGKGVDGTWELVLEDRPEVRALLESGGLDDILLVIGYRALTPPYPA